MRTFCLIQPLTSGIQRRLLLTIAALVGLFTTLKSHRHGVRLLALASQCSSTQVVLSSVTLSKACRLLSRPWPDCL